MTGYAKVTGRVIGPEGLGRMGTISFVPDKQYQAVEEGGRRSVVATYAAARFTPEGVLTDMAGNPWANIAAPESLPEGETNYLIAIEIPGDTGVTEFYRARLLANKTIDLVDIIAARWGEESKPGKRRVRHVGGGILESEVPGEVIEIGAGILAWKEQP